MEETLWQKSITFVELVVKDLEMLTSHLEELLVSEEDGKVEKPRA